MSEIKLISPILDGFIVGDPISDRNGVRTYPAINETTQEKCIVKVISVPSSPTQLDALLLSGAYETKEDALKYYESLASDIINEIEILHKLSELEGYMPFTAYQTVAMEDGNGFDVYLRNSYKLSLARKFGKETMTHLGALNLGLDLCAALSVCRRLGYIYVDLKPENIYITTDNGYRIGDIGFLNLDSLRYASLPDRYRSAYTAPELSDPLSPLNTTMDVYAVGMILYQAFNGGILPAAAEDAVLPSPDYADYEMAEIILKACAKDPADRWADPIQLGNALVGYMQRNGAHDTPIVPPTVPVQEEAISECEQDEASVSEQITSGVEEDETLPGADVEDMDYEQVSEEVNEILTQADDLIAHDTPDPVQPPEPVDVQLPVDDNVEQASHTEDTSESENIDSAPISETVAEEIVDSDTAPSADAGEASADMEEPSENEENQQAAIDDADIQDADNQEKPRRPWVAIVAIAAALILLIVGGILYYKHIYIQHIDELRLEANGTNLTVYVSTDFDETKLVVICSDMYDQNQREAAVIDGVAQFTDLPLGSPFTINVEVKGFHALKGQTTKTYVTPKATQVIDFVALTGPEDGTVNLSFSVSGPDSTEWNITYYADGVESSTVTCIEHTASIPGLLIGKEYTFHLQAKDDVQLMEDEYVIKYIPTISVVAEDFHINSYENGKIEVSWTSSNNTSSAKWQVRCYSSSESSNVQSIVTGKTQATFDGLSENEIYTIEIRGENMSQVSVFTVPANPIKIHDFTASTENGVTVLSWNCESENVTNKWLLHCTNQESFTYYEVISDNTVTLHSLVPGAEYHFMLSHEDTTITDALVGNCLNYQTPDAEPFSNYNIDAEDIRFELCLTPSDDGDQDAYTPTNTFIVGQKAYMGINLGSSVRRPNNDVQIHFVVQDETGKILDATVKTENWGELWTWRGTGKLHLPYLPELPGNYTLTIYFDSAFAMTEDFTITES